MALFSLTFLILITFYIKKIKLFYPLGLIILFFFIVPYLLYPLFKIISFKNLEEIKVFLDDINHALIIINFVYIFWIFGFFSLGKQTNKIININFDYRDRIFANALIFSGICLYFFVFSYVGISFINSFSDPLGTRFSIINKSGGFYLRSISFWLMWCGWFLKFLLFIKGFNINKIRLIILFVFIIFLSFPLGQRSLILFPIIYLVLLMYYLKLISFKRISFLLLFLFFLVPVLGLYRQLGSSEYLSIDKFISSFNLIFANFQDILFLLSERINNLYFFTIFLEFKDQVDYDLIDSISGFFNLFIPSFVLLGDKSVDLTTLLTIKYIGSVKMGTYDFTSFPEWLLIGGYFAIPIFAFFSGLINRIIVDGVFKLGSSIFFLMLFTHGFFLKMPFLNINNINNIFIIIFLIYSIFIYLLYNTYKRFR
jgi:hypothetical protein